MTSCIRRCAAATILSLILGFGLTACDAAIAQPPGKDVPDAGETVEEFARDSPRASLTHFLTLTRSRDFEGAAVYLELTPADQPRGPELARKLKAVLDRRVWLEPDDFSPLATGNPDDGLPAFTDEVGQIKNKVNVVEPVRIVRRKRDTVLWMFSQGTVRRIDGWYEQLDDRWVLEHMPPRLLRTGPRDLMWWQWLALPVVIGISWLLGFLLSALSTKIMAAIAARSRANWDDLVVVRLKKPVTLWWALAASYCMLPWLALYAPAEKFALSTLRTLFLVGFFFALSGVIDVAAESIQRSTWGAVRQSSNSLFSLGARVAKVALMAIAVVALMSQLGYPVASILAGLGVGGLAVALAAQKTVENLFGAFSIGADQPFREGELVRVGDFTGTCELIGLRSTKFRTADRTMISIPNGKLADMQIETFARRDRLRFAMTLGLVRSTTSAQVREVIAQVDALLKGHPKLYPNSAAVRFEKFGPSSLDLTVEAYFDTRDWAEFANIRGEVLLRIMEIVERAGSTLALNAQHVQLLPQRSHELATARGAHEARDPHDDG